MFILHLPDKETALLILYYASMRAEQIIDISLIEAPRILDITKKLIESLREPMGETNIIRTLKETDRFTP